MWSNLLRKTETTTAFYFTTKKESQKNIGTLDPRFNEHGS